MARPKPKQQQATHSALAKKIAERWGDTGGDVLLDRLVSELQGEQRYDVVAALKELERLGSGEFLVGSAGGKARFIWRGRGRGDERGAAAVTGGFKARGGAKATSARKLKPASQTTSQTSARPEHKPVPATKKAKPVATVTAPKSTPVGTRTASTRPRGTARSESLDHVFHLRPGYVVTVHLPTDVSRVEMDRFCQFLQSIPFETRS